MLHVPGLVIENMVIDSLNLGREVTVDFYLPSNVPDPGKLHLLLINDGQNLEEMGLKEMVTELYQSGAIQPVLCVGIHCGPDRKMEYGVTGFPDYLGRGAAAGNYTQFILAELLPLIHEKYNIETFASRAFAGFSLGGLMALDITWNHPDVFHAAGVFSGSLWWRSIDQHEAEYDDNRHRIIHQVIRNGEYKPGLAFFFQSGNMDETNDRNNNGIIDSIDDTLDLMAELEAKGYRRDKDIKYLEMPEGRHDIATWAKAFPEFLEWCWGTSR